MPVRILIADDHEVARRGIRELLGQRPDFLICGEATDGLEAVEAARQFRPDVILMDISMPRMNGIEATRIIRREFPEAAVLIVSQNDPAVASRQAGEVDACGFVSKNSVGRDLIGSVDAAFAARGSIGDSALSPSPRNPLAMENSSDTEMVTLIRDKDWAKTRVGPPESWSPALRTVVDLLLANRFPLLLWWGPDYIQFYNDAYKQIPGTKHPASLGQPARECWPEIWHILRPLVDTPFNGGPSTWSEDLELEYRRSSSLIETHFTVAYSPVPDPSAPRGIGGVLATVHEVTGKVIGERRLAMLRELAARITEGKTGEEACSLAAQIVARYPKDIPFALFYLFDPERGRAHLAASAGFENEAVIPSPVDISDGSERVGAWPFSAALRQAEMSVVENVGSRLRNAPPSPWSDAPHTAVVVPIASNKPHDSRGAIVFGVSVRLDLDKDYRTFFQLIAAQLSSAIANAEAYEEERKRAEALAEIDRAKTLFFSNVSHEFRTPLTLMLAPLEDALSSADSLEPQQRERLEVAHRNSLRLLKLVNTLLDFSRIEAGRIQASYEPIDLSIVTADLASLFRSAVERAGVRLIIDCPQISEPVYVDREMWEKIVLNLISNAFKFTFAGEIEIALRQANSAAELVVRDTGTGIPAKDLPHLFERFYRVKGVHGRTFEGSGIGLALVQELVKLHGGAVHVESELNRGTKFTVAIPMGKSHLPPDRISGARPPASAGLRGETYVQEALRWLPDSQGAPAEISPGASLATAPPLHRIRDKGQTPTRILLADDNADMREYVQRLLQDTYEVIAVTDGQSGLESARERRPDLVLSDVMMPRLDGFGLLRELRADENLNTVPVILVSARAGEESRIEGLRAGADDYIVKPFSARELLARVESQLSLAKLRRRSAELERQLRERAETLAETLDAEVRARTRELEEGNAEILRRAEQVRELSWKLLHAQDEERRHVARELHDSAGQTLAVLGMNLGALAENADKRRPELRQSLTQANELVQQLTKEIRTMSYLLHPPLLDDNGLPAALSWYIGGLGDRSGLDISFEISEGFGRLSREMELVIFRLVQECLTNIHRHSGSKTAAIQVIREPERVLVEVRDQGKGIPAEKLAEIQTRGSGVGIRGMRERLRQFHGEMIIESTSLGTVVLVTIPISTERLAKDHSVVHPTERSAESTL